MGQQSTLKVKLEIQNPPQKDLMPGRPYPSGRVQHQTKSPKHFFLILDHNYYQAQPHQMSLKQQINRVKCGLTAFAKEVEKIPEKCTRIVA